MIIQTGVPAWHTPEEMRALSNAAHVAEGAIVSIVALLALAEASGRLRDRNARYAWPSLPFLAGTFLFLYLLLPHHGLSRAAAQWRFIFGDPQQRQHLLIAGTLLVGSAAELGHRRGGRAWLRLVFPAALAVAALVFLLHTQHGESGAIRRAVLIHRLLALSLGLAGGLSLAARLRPAATWLKYAWPCALMISALLLLVYREPAGAYAAPTADSADHHIGGDP